MSTSVVMVTVPKATCQHGSPWAKRIRSVDAHAKSGHDYHGEFLPPGGLADLSVGDVVICGGWHGSRKNGAKTADCYVLGPGRWLRFGYYEGEQWAMKARQEVRAVLAMSPRERIAYAAAEELRLYPRQEAGYAETMAALIAVYSAPTADEPAEEPAEEPAGLAGVADEDLVAEVRRRGLAL